MDFSNLVLSWRQRRLLFKAYWTKGGVVSISDDDSALVSLIEAGLLGWEYEDKYAITTAGRNYYRYRRRDVWRYWVTTGIAILALVLAVISLLAELGLLLLPQLGAQ